MSEKIEASAAEWEVLRVVWSLDDASSRSVSDVLKSTQNWENATTKTLLGRLVKKGYLKTEKIGNKFIYHSVMAQQDGVNNRFSELMDSVCAKTRGQALVSIIDMYELSLDDRDAIIKALDKKHFTHDLQCQCLGGCNCEEGKCTCNHNQ